MAIPDEFSASHRLAVAQCNEYRMAAEVTLAPLRQRELYDPCSPENVRPATDLEVAEMDLKLLKQQLAGLRSMLARREKTDPDSPLMQDYRLRVRWMEQAISDANARRDALEAAASAALAAERASADPVEQASGPHARGKIASHKRVESRDSLATRCPSKPGSPCSLGDFDDTTDYTFCMRTQESVNFEESP